VPYVAVNDVSSDRRFGRTHSFHFQQHFSDFTVYAIALYFLQAPKRKFVSLRDIKINSTLNGLFSFMLRDFYP
jgi:hypothetical protein